MSRLFVKVIRPTSSCIHKLKSGQHLAVRQFLFACFTETGRCISFAHLSCPSCSCQYIWSCKLAGIADSCRCRSSYGCSVLCMCAEQSVYPLENNCWHRCQMDGTLLASPLELAQRTPLEQLRRVPPARLRGFFSSFRLSIVELAARLEHLRETQGRWRSFRSANQSCANMSR
jgi:hypothetical protein